MQQKETMPKSARLSHYDPKKHQGKVTKQLSQKERKRY